MIQPLCETVAEILYVGDPVSLPDGQYLYKNYIYVVENGVLAHIFSALTDENQLSLELEKEVVLV